MADENKPAFYPRVGNIRNKNFVPAKPMPFIDDERAMELPQYSEFIPKLGTVDLSVPTKENRELNRRITQRDADLMRQVQADRSFPEKLAGGLQAGRLMGSALTQGINSIPTRLFKGDEAADKFMQERIYKPEQPLAYEYAQDIGDLLGSLETDYKIPPLMPEAVALQYLTGPATSQAMRAAGRGAEQAGRKLESAMEPVVKGALERGGLPREMAMAMGANTQSNVMKPSNKANWMSGPSIHVPEGDAWRFKTPPFAGETPAQRIPHHEELLNDPTLNQDQIDRVLYQLELAKGEAALDKWADNALMGYFKGQLASPEDPVRLMIERNYANIEAKFAKDQERATKMAQRAEAELDPRKQANMKRQADTMFVQAKDDREIAMQNISHLPSEMLQDITLDPKSYIKEERVKAGYPAEGLGTTDPSRKWEHQADEAVKVTRAGDIQGAMDLQPRIDQALQEQFVVYQKLNKEWGDLLRSKGLQEKDIAALMTSMPRNTKAEAVGMLDELQKVDSNYLRLLDQDRSFPKFAAQDNPFVAKLDPETKMYSGYMGDLGFEHVMDVLRQDLAAERLRPEQLNKLSVEQAVKRTQEYNLDLARKMNADRASARANLPVYKEYPDGYKWVQLNKPGNFAAESEAMGHSVKGYEPSKKHPEWVKGSGDEGSPSYGLGGWEAIKSGRAKIYSLVDSRGAPHATIEVASGAHPIGYSFKGASKELPETFEYNRNFDEGFPRPTEEQKQAILSRAQDLFKNNSNIERMDAFQMAANEVLGPLPAEIRQIKGKGNAKPIAEYTPYVQDFVRSGNWTDVRDFSNTDLIRAEDVRKAGWDMTGIDSPYLTKQEYDDLLLNELNKPKGMKRGGVVVSNNPDTMMLEVNNQKMAGGGAIAKLMRAAPKSKAEIDAIARRMAPQMLGEFVRGRAGSQSVAEKTQKQFAREKEMVHDIRPTGVERGLPRTVDIEELKDNVMVGIAGDPTISGKTIYSVNGVELESPSPQHGGPLYGLEHEGDAFWASGLGAANRVQNIAREASKQYDLPVLGNYVMMGPDSINYAQHYADANLAAINPSKMSRGQIEDFNKLVRLGSKKSGPRPSFPGIENPSEAYLHFSVDPELRKHFNALMQMPTVTQKYNLPSGVDIRHAVTEPDLRDLEIGVTGKSIGRLRPEIEDLGYSEHPTYSHDIPGEFMGSTKYNIPYELSFPDSVKSVRENPKQAPQEFGSFKYVGPRQVIDQQLIDEIKQYQEMIKKYTGKKKGGAVKKAEGGYLKKPAAYINGDEFVNAAKKYGIKDSMNNLNKIVDLVNKGLSVDDAARQVADSGMHKAAGGAIRGDDLILEERPL
jgi:hypothetical protein